MNVGWLVLAMAAAAVLIGGYALFVVRQKRMLERRLRDLRTE